MSRKVIFTICFSFLFLIVAPILYKSKYSFSANVLTVDQLKIKRNDAIIFQQNFKLTGIIDVNSISKDKSVSEAKFYIYSDDLKSKVHVVYKGGGLNTIGNGSKLILEGKYTVERMFIANKLTLVE